MASTKMNAYPTCGACGKPTIPMERVLEIYDRWLMAQEPFISVSKQARLLDQAKTDITNLISAVNMLLDRVNLILVQRNRAFDLLEAAGEKYTAPDQDDTVTGHDDKGFSSAAENVRFFVKQAQRRYAPGFQEGNEPK